MSDSTMTLQFALAYLKSLMLTPDRGGMEGAIAVLLPAYAALEQELIAARAELQTQKHNALAGLMAAATFAAEDEAWLKAALAAERIENQRLRDAFVAMERAYNQREAEVERLARELAEAREEIAKLRGELDGQCQHGIAEDEECEECEKAAHEYMKLLDERKEEK
jgi:chromosome segregation ATPase